MKVLTLLAVALANSACILDENRMISTRPLLAVAMSCPLDEFEAYSGCQISHNGKYIVTIQESGSLTIREIPSLQESAKCIFRKKSKPGDPPNYGVERASSVCFDRNDPHQVFFYNRHAIYSWNWKTRKSPVRITEIPKDLQSASLAIECSPDGKWLGVMGIKGNVLVIQMNQKEVRVSSITADEDQLSCRALGFSGDSKFLYYPRRNQLMKVRLGDKAEDPRSVAEVGQGLEIYDVAFCPQQDRAATSTEDGQVYVWDLRKGTKEPFLPKGQKVINIAISADGNILAVEKLKGVIEIWSLSKMSRIWQGAGPKDGLISMGIAHDNITLFGVGAAPSVYSWPIETRKDK